MLFPRTFLARTVLAANLAAGLVLTGTGCDVITIDHGKQAVLEARAETLAEAYCAAYTACDCAPFASDALHPDPEQCEAEEQERLVRAFDAAEERGLSFDQDCMEHLVARYGELGCDAQPSLEAALGSPTLAENFGCALYHGEVEGGICELVPGTSFDDCTAGSRCFDNACHPQAVAGELGDACNVGLSWPTIDCGAGLVCDPNAGCQPGQELGEPCLLGGDGSLRCAPELRCVAPDLDTIEGTCQARLAAGEPCEGEGDCYGWCREGACVDVPALCLDSSLQPPVDPVD